MKYSLFAIFVSFTLSAQTVTEICQKQFGMEILSQQENLQLMNKACLVKNYIQESDYDKASVEEFLALEKEIGENVWDLNHVNDLQVFRIQYGYNYLYNFISSENLKSMIKFGIKNLGIYQESDIFDGYWDILDVLRGAKTVEAKELEMWLTDEFLTIAEDDYHDQDEINAVKEKVIRREKLKPVALKSIVKLLVGDNDKVSIYPLLDNNNENVQDAQWVLVGREYIVLINRFWYL